ncbi:MAG: LamG-like jellyroll fold domain-containing protein [Planctomycetota bacterium]
MISGKWASGDTSADGIEVASEAKTWDLVLGRAHIGRQVNDAAEFWDGLVDDVRIYDRVLTVQEIQQTMRGDPMLAWDPSPADGSTPDVVTATPLSWSLGDKASEHDVYFGTDKDAVTDADASDTTGIYRGRQGGAVYTPSEVLEWDSGPYYWRIDEYNADATVSEGRVWSFTVADYLIVDDIESYNDLEEGEPGSNRIFVAWVDGYGTTTNGSVIGNLNPPFANRSNVHGGTQSMPYSYDNNLKSSQATLTLTSLRDWTKEGVVTLSLWFSGDPANAPEPMYVVLNGSAPVYHDDSGAAQTGAWTEWTISLQKFADLGVDLTNVTSITIGFGTPGAATPGGVGTMLFDDIRLYR